MVCNIAYIKFVFYGQIGLDVSKQLFYINLFFKKSQRPNSYLLAWPVGSAGSSLECDELLLPLGVDRDHEAVQLGPEGFHELGRIFPPLFLQGWGGLMPVLDTFPAKFIEGGWMRSKSFINETLLTLSVLMNMLCRIVASLYVGISMMMWSPSS